MIVHPQMTEAKSNFVRKARKVREKRQNQFFSLRPSRLSRTDVFVSLSTWRRNKSNNDPQMNANERECSAFHLRPLRFSRTDAFASVIAWRRDNSNADPQMNANERECSVCHLRSLRFSRTDAFAVLTGVAA